MFGSEIPEIAVGVGFLYLLLSLVCSAITEGIARAFAMRSGTLRSGIRNLLCDPHGKGLAKDFYNHPLIKGLYRRGWFDRMIGRDGNGASRLRTAGCGRSSTFGLEYVHEP